MSSISPSINSTVRVLTRKILTDFLLHKPSSRDLRYGALSPLSLLPPSPIYLRSTIYSQCGYTPRSWRLSPSYRFLTFLFSCHAQESDGDRRTCLHLRRSDPLRRRHSDHCTFLASFLLAAFSIFYWGCCVSVSYCVYAAARSSSFLPCMCELSCQESLQCCDSVPRRDCVVISMFLAQMDVSVCRALCS